MRFPADGSRDFLGAWVALVVVVALILVGVLVDPFGGHHGHRRSAPRKVSDIQRPVTPLPVLPVGAETNPTPFGGTPDTPLPPPDLRLANLASVGAAPSTGPYSFQPSGTTGSWPDMCTVTDTAQLSVLYPPVMQVTGVEGQRTATFGGGQTATNTDCKYRLKTSYDRQAGGVAGQSYVELQIEEVDSGAGRAWVEASQMQQQQAAQNPAQWASYTLPDGTQCFYDGRNLQCLKGGVEFWVSGDKETGGLNYPADQMVWIDEVELPLAAKFATEMVP